MNSLNDVNVPNVQCTQYLIDGEITNWTGPSAEVFSNIYLSKNKQGELGPTLIGNVPDLDEDVSIKALDAAVNAFSRGQGKWPTMKVKERISCMETFVKLSLIHI